MPGLCCYAAAGGRGPREGHGVGGLEEGVADFVDRSRNELPHVRRQPGGDREAAAQSVYRDLAAVWLGNAPQPQEGIAPEGRFVEFTLPLPDGDELRYRFAGKPLQLVEKSCRGFWKRRWRVRYYDWKRTGGRWSVGNAVLDDDASGCRIVVRTRTVTPEGGKIE